MNIDTRIIHNFLSDAEIQTLLEEIKEHVKGFPDEDKSVLEAFVFKNKYITDTLKEIFEPKFVSMFHPDIVIEQGHILTSYIPYGIHTDARGGYGISDTRKAAWTFIIPIDNYESNTIVFKDEDDEGSDHPDKYIEKYNIPIGAGNIDDDTYNKYFSHLYRDYIGRFTVESIFPWTKGSMFAASRRKFHMSDNFPAKGLECKKGIVMWTSVPR